MYVVERKGYGAAPLALQRRSSVKRRTTSHFCRDDKVYPNRRPVRNRRVPGVSRGLWCVCHNVAPTCAKCVNSVVAEPLLISLGAGKGKTGPWQLGRFCTMQCTLHFPLLFMSYRNGRTTGCIIAARGGTGH